MSKHLSNYALSASTISWVSLRSLIDMSSNNCTKRFISFFQEAYTRKWERLIDLNVHIINYILKQLSISTPIYFESELDIINEGTDRIIEICKKRECNTYLSGTGGKAYLEEEKFTQAEVKLLYQDFVHPVYHQRFMQDEDNFIPYMSILDLLFNEGPKAREILR